MNSTYRAKDNEVKHEWYLINAEGKILGRLASEIAQILRGKKKPIYSPDMMNGDNLIVINAEKVKLTGNKLEGKKYYRHSGYPGGLKERSAKDILEKRPEELIRLAVKGMLPKNRLGRKLIKKLKVYADDAHPHFAQKPEQLSL